MSAVNLQHVYVSLHKSLMLILLLIAEHSSAHQIRQDLKSHPNWGVLDRGDDCGHSYAADRIIGGYNASLGQYPWIARLGYTYEIVPGDLSIDLYDCGGTIISDRYILTAAHCSPEVVGIKLVKVRLGEHDTSQDKDCVDGVCAPPVQDIGIEKYTCHPGYNNTNFHNDICLIRLEKPMQFNDYVSPICLPSYDTFIQENAFKGAMMEVAGWGVTDPYTKMQSDILQTVQLPVLPQDECAKAYRFKTKIVSSQMCVGGTIGKDSCSGDSGGPLTKPFSIDAPPRYFIIGIVSFGPSNCARTAMPGVYTVVSAYMPWILDTVHK